MGSYAELKIGDFYLGSSKNEVDPSIMMLFRKDDKIIYQAHPKDLRLEHNFIVEEFEDDEQITILQYASDAKSLKDRIDLMGITLEMARQAFQKGLNDEIKRFEEWSKKPDSEAFKRHLNLIKDINIDTWIDALKKIRTEKLYLNEAKPYDAEEYTLIDEMLSKKHDFYGFPFYDYRCFLRILLETCDPDEKLVYDLTDLANGGWVDDTDDQIEQFEEIISEEFRSSKKIIVLTEGSSDKWILERSLKLLRPQVSDYFHFMDFKNTNLGGGADSLVHIVRAFIGAGIANKIVAIFDNDAAANLALKALEHIKIPGHFKILTLPETDFLCQYPTIGPTGVVNMNVNGLAGSIELYLGKDILSEGDGFLINVQWKGYISKINCYQGEVLNKERIQKEYEKKLKICEKDKAKIKNYNWDQIEIVLDALTGAVREIEENRYKKYLETDDYEYLS